MTKLLFLFFVFMSQAAQLDLDEAIEYIENYEDGYSLFFIGNGDYYFEDYDVNNFDMELEQEKLGATYLNNDGNCVYEDLSPATDLEMIIYKEDNNGNSDAVEALENLENTGMIEAVLSRSWDGASGDSEYCLREGYRIYLKNGKVLVIDYDETT